MTSAVVKQGGLSSICIFHRGLGSNDEAASQGERAERVLYYYPHETPISEILRRISYYEGLIDFNQIFSPQNPVQSITLQKRRYTFLEVEPQVWMVLGIVREQISVAVQGYPRTTDATDVLPPSASNSTTGTTNTVTGNSTTNANNAALNTNTGALSIFSSGGTYIGPPYPRPNPASATSTSVYTSEGINDTMLRTVMVTLWDGFRLFYGPIHRVLNHPYAKDACIHIANLRTLLRKTRDAREAAEGNAAYRSNAALLEREMSEQSLFPIDPSSEPIGLETIQETDTSVSGTQNTADDPPSSDPRQHEQTMVKAMQAAQEAAEQALVASAEEYVLQCHLRVLERYSPVGAIRRTLRSWLDWAVYHTDWSHLSPIDASGSYLRSAVGNLRRDITAALTTLAGKLSKGIPALRTLTMLYDGYIIFGDNQPHIHTLYSYLRSHTFHTVLGATSDETGKVNASNATTGSSTSSSSSLRTTLYEPDRQDYDISTEELYHGGMDYERPPHHHHHHNHHHHHHHHHNHHPTASPPSLRDTNTGSINTMNRYPFAVAGSPNSPTPYYISPEKSMSPVSINNSTNNPNFPSVPNPPLRRNLSSGSAYSGSTGSLYSMGGTMSTSNVHGLLNKERSLSMRSPSANGGAGFTAGMVSFIDGRAWSQPIDISSLTVDLADMLAAQPQYLSTLLNIVGSEVTAQEGNGSKPVTVSYSSRTLTIVRTPLVESAIKQAVQSIQPISSILVPSTPVSTNSSKARSTPTTNDSEAGIISATTPPVDTSNLPRHRQWDIYLRENKVQPEEMVQSSPEAMVPSSLTSSASLSRFQNSHSTSSQNLSVRPARATSQSLPVSVKTSTSAHNGTTVTNNNASASRGGTVRHPLHNPNNKPSTLTVPVLPGAADVSRSLRNVVTVDETWPVLALPYVSFSYLDTLGNLLVSSGYKKIDNTKIDVKNGAVTPVSSGCLGPVWPPVTTPNATTSTGNSAVASRTAVPNTTNTASSTSVASAQSQTLRRAFSWMPLFRGSDSNETNNPSGTGGSTLTVTTNGTANTLNNSFNAEESRMFLPALFDIPTTTTVTDESNTYRPEGLPSCRMIWVQQGLVTVLAGIDASALTGRSSSATNEASPTSFGTPAITVSSPNDIDERIVQNLARTLAHVTEVFIPPLEKILGDIFDAKATKAIERGLEGVKNYHIDNRNRSLDIHGTQYGTRRPGKGKNTTGALVSQATVVSSADMNSSGDIPAHLAPAVSVLRETGIPPLDYLVDTTKNGTAATTSTPNLGKSRANSATEEETLPFSSGSNGNNDPSVSFSSTSDYRTSLSITPLSDRQICRQLLFTVTGKDPLTRKHLRRHTNPADTDTKNTIDLFSIGTKDEGVINGNQTSGSRRSSFVSSTSTATAVEPLTKDIPSSANESSDPTGIPGRPPVPSIRSKNKVHSVWPNNELYLLATRTSGVVSGKRAMNRSSIVVFDENTVDKRRYDAHVDNDLRELVNRTIQTSSWE